ncbi:diadenylate cyclase CdaA [Geobacter sp. AOG1]|uniref:diadenylate cyclase CdaA n=1 Tax=Geobacter sp. AOG1 TaxID=1566346 RepID=UPI001CC3AAA7|nr:diadenylate cyclase CdaA [Geobacter sp. AOG1]GFE57840.1 adenylate cyclase [Geobacter sp. AOG1]
MFPYIRVQDIIDIIIMSFLVYQLYSWFRNTKAMQVVIGLGFLGALYVVTKNLGLFMTSWILQELGTVLFVLLIVIFQSEIRQALYRFSLLRNLFDRQENSAQLDFMDIANTVFSLASRRTGAIIVFQRREPLDEYLLHGVQVDGLVTAQLIGSIFLDGTPLHDGAVLIRDGRVIQASCHLPLSANSDLPQYYGTRHRAGLGLSERSDATVVIVSEERGEVSLALAGELLPIATPEQLSERLHALLAPPSQEIRKIPWRRRLFGNLMPKLATVLLVVVCWLLITTREGGVITVAAPIKYHNLPEGLALTRTTPEEVEVQLKFISRLIPSPKNLDVVADLDLASIREGNSQLAVKGDNFQLPTGVVVTGVKPSVVRVMTEKKIRKMVRIRVKTVGMLPGQLHIKRLTSEPGTVLAEGPAHMLSQLESVATEEIDLSAIHQSTVVEKRLVMPSPQLRVLQDEPVKVRVNVVGR